MPEPPLPLKKTVRFAIDDVEDGNASATGDELGTSNIPASSKQSVRFADDDEVLSDHQPSARTTRTVRFEMEEVQKLKSSPVADMVNSSSNPHPSSKRVRFAVHDVIMMGEPSTHNTRSVHFAKESSVESSSDPVEYGSESIHETDNVIKKKVRFVDDIELPPPQNPTPARTTTATSLASQLFAQPPDLCNTLLDTDTSLTTPPDDDDTEDFWFPGCSCFTPCPTVDFTAAADASALSISPGPLQESHVESTPSSPTHQHQTIDHHLPNTSAIPRDPGERNEQGHVLAPSTEPCEKCGGKVVWATKGEW